MRPPVPAAGPSGRGLRGGPDAGVLPGPVSAGLGVRAARPLSGGGSPATVWLAETSGEPVVVKLLRDRPGRVDGHDLASFRAKPRQLRLVARALPALAPFLVPVLGDWHGPGWAAYAMPAVEGRPLCAPLAAEPADPQAFAAAARRVFGILGEHGYLVDAGPAPADHFEATHPQRLARRLPLLRRHLDPVLLGAAPLLVNGRPVPTLPDLLARLASQPRLLAELRPARLAPPVHGDLNLGNVLVADPNADRFTVLDPRGTLQPWDPVYDLAKGLFSLTVFEAALDGGFAVARAAGPGEPVRYTVALRRPRPAQAAAGGGFVDLLAGLPLGRELDRVDPGWRLRALASHAFHCLAEAACRLSDSTPRTVGTRSGAAARVELATGLFLAGLTLLADLLDAPPGGPEPAAHLAALAPLRGSG